MKIKNWIACVQHRGKWKEIVEKAKTFNQEVQHLEEEEEEVYYIKNTTILYNTKYQKKIATYSLLQ